MRKKEPGIHPDEKLRRKCGGRRGVVTPSYGSATRCAERGRPRGSPLRVHGKRCGAGVLRMSLFRRTKFPHRLTADAPNFDRGHWLRPTVVPADSRPLSWPPIGALPRNRLAYSAAGSASAISPLHPPPAALGSLPTGAERPRNDRHFGKGCGEAGRPGGRPLRVHDWKVRCTGDYGLPQPVCALTSQ